MVGVCGTVPCGVCEQCKQYRDKGYPTGLYSGDKSIPAVKMMYDVPSYNDSTEELILKELKAIHRLLKKQVKK